MGTGVVKHTATVYQYISLPHLILIIVSKIDSFPNIVSKSEIQHLENGNENLFYLGLRSSTQTVSR